MIPLTLQPSDTLGGNPLTFVRRALESPLVESRLGMLAVRVPAATGLSIHYLQGSHYRSQAVAYLCRLWA